MMSEASFLILLGLLPMASVSSQTLLDITMILLFLGMLSAAFKNGFRAVAPKRLGIEWAFLAYFIVVCLGFIFNASSEAPWLQSLGKFSWVFNLYILIFVFENVEIKIEKAIFYVCSLLLLPTLYSLFCYWLGYDLITARDNARITGLVDSATYHAHGNAVVFVFFTMLFLFRGKNMPLGKRVLSAISLILLGASVFLTFTRGIWLSLLISTLIMTTIINFKRTLLLLFGVILFSAGLYFSWPKLQERMDPTNRSNSTSERVNLFKVNVQMWQEYPLLGIGYGENVRRNREYWDRPEWKMKRKYITSHAHNQFLNVLSTTGIFGLIFFVSFTVFFLRKNIILFRKAAANKASDFYVWLFACLWAQTEFLLACMSDVSFEYAKIRALLILVWALVVALEYKMKKAGILESASGVKP